jgi:hypothetical protein
MLTSCHSNFKTIENDEVLGKDEKSAPHENSLNDTINKFINTFLQEERSIEKSKKGLVLDSTFNYINLRLIWDKEGFELKWRYKEKSHKLILNKELNVGYVNPELIRPFAFMTPNLFTVRFGCGSPFWYDVILSLNGERSPEKVDYLMHLDSNYYVKLGDAANSLIIVNYKLGKSYVVPVQIPIKWESRNGVFLPEMIDYIEIKDNIIVLGQYKKNELIKTSIKFKV